MQKLLLIVGGLVLCLMSWPLPSRAWDYAGHRIINQLALASLPTNYPGYAKTAPASERIAFLGGEADRWRNTPDLAFRHRNGPDHFLDADELPLYHLDPAELSPFRYEFVAQLVRGREAYLTNFPPIDPKRDTDHTRSLVGFLPWTISEYYSQLKSAFSYLKTFEESGGTVEEIANARQNVVYLMGVMGHFVGDATQPLHTTKHYNGWVGPNPNHYTTARAFHAWIDGSYLQKAGLKTEDLMKRVPTARLLSDAEMKGAQTNVFPVVLVFLLDQSKLVGPLYRLEQQGKLAVDGAVTDEGTEFITSQLIKGAQMLGDLWLTAWTWAPPDKFLSEELARRRAGEARKEAATGK